MMVCDKNENKTSKHCDQQLKTPVRVGFGTELAETLFNRDVQAGRLPHVQEIIGLLNVINPQDPKYVMYIFNFIEQRLVFNDERLKHLLVLGLRAIVMNYQQTMKNVSDMTLVYKLFLMLYLNPLFIRPCQYQYINDQAKKLYPLLCSKITRVDDAKLSPFELFNQRLQANFVQGIYETVRFGKYATYGQEPIDAFQVTLKNVMTNIFINPGLMSMRRLFVENNKFFDAFAFSAEEIKDFERLYGLYLRPLQERIRLKK